MELEELEQAIMEALVKGRIAAPTKECVCPQCGYHIPDDAHRWLQWTQELGVYLYELAVRNVPNFRINDAKRKAWWATKRRIRDETVASIMNIRLEGEPEGLYTRSTEEICDCGRHKNPGYPQCFYCSKQKYKEINAAAQAPSPAPPQKAQSAPDQAEPDETPSSRSSRSPR